jgi:DNA-binding NarL/FixJ family response regulator
MSTKNNKNNVASAVATLATKQAELEAARLAAAELEKEVQAEQERVRLELVTKVNALPAQFNLETMDQFIDLINEVAGRKASSKHPRISNETKAEITNLLKAGKTAKELAAQFNVSGATVNSLKKAAGLTKPRTVKAVEVPPAV